MCGKVSSLCWRYRFADTTASRPRTTLTISNGVIELYTRRTDGERNRDVFFSLSLSRSLVLSSGFYDYYRTLCFGRPKKRARAAGRQSARAQGEDEEEEPFIIRGSRTFFESFGPRRALSSARSLFLSVGALLGGMRDVRKEAITSSTRSPLL